MDPLAAEASDKIDAAKPCLAVLSAVRCPLSGSSLSSANAGALQTRSLQL